MLKNQTAERSSACDSEKNAVEVSAEFSVPNSEADSKTQRFRGKQAEEGEPIGLRCFRGSKEVEMRLLFFLFFLSLPSFLPLSFLYCLLLAAWTPLGCVRFSRFTSGTDLLEFSGDELYCFKGDEFREDRAGGDEIVWENLSGDGFVGDDFSGDLETDTAALPLTSELCLSNNLRGW
jgi:hypothetical protein